MASGITCIVTIHGIGFQQPPLEGVSGYADDLHTHLCSALNKDGQVLLSDDPDRQPHQRGESVPIYVQSVWPPNSNCQEDGMKRLGTWLDNRRATVSHDDDTQALVKGNARIAHVALVYSGLEGQGPQASTAIIAGAAALFYAGHYSNFKSLIDEVYQDTETLRQSLWTHMWANLFKHPAHEDPERQQRTSLRVRQDKGHLQQTGSTNGSTGQPDPAFVSILRQLENDVASYFCDNGERQRVRSFILDALLRLACRDDVSGIVLNTHSNGTVIGLDVVPELSLFVPGKIRAVITAGSPIRKYVDLFSWGQHLAMKPKIERWWNFWDEKDPVADPLSPYAGWRRGVDPEPEQLPAEHLVGIYQSLDPDTGAITPTVIKDIPADNMVNSLPCMMRAHNYWDNTKEFIPKVVDLLNEVIAEEDAAAADKAIPAGS